MVCCASAGASTTWGFHADYNGTSNPVPTITCAGPSQGSGSATLSGPLDPLGVNTAAWDSNFTDPAIASDLSAAGVGLIRYPGGSWADQYLWQPNTVSGSWRRAWRTKVGIARPSVSRMRGP